MSRSPDNENGATERSPITVSDMNLSLLPEDYHAATPLPPLPERATSDPNASHRRAQSHFQIPTGANQRHRGRHHRNRSSIGQFMATIGEGVREESTVVRDAWKQELEDGETGKRYFLDMNLTRSLSLLPEDIQEFSNEAVRRRSSVAPVSVEETEAPPPLPPTKVASLSSYLALLAAVLAVSSNGTALAMLHDVHPALKLFWRMTAVATLLSFFAIKTMYHQYQDEQKFLPKLTWTQWSTFFSAALCFFLHTLLLFTAFTLTSIGNAVIGANSQALLLVLGKLVTGHKVVWMEGLGVLTAFSGVILCTSDEVVDDIEDEDEGQNYKALLGNALAFGSAVTGVGYLTFAKAVRSHIEVTVFMFMVMLSGFILTFIYICATGVEFTWGNDPHHGLFGWMTLEGNHIFVILHVAVICNIVGTMGFVRAMEFFSNIIIAVATLLEPMIATLIAFALGVGELPGTMGWIGNFLVALGTLGVVYPSIDNGEGGGH